MLHLKVIKKKCVRGALPNPEKDLGRGSCVGTLKTTPSPT